ncbi:MAG: DUF1667 domain-containing protein [Lachnospiraceae bacterium]|nr:DUF1667 domain-containing protein [Lachnospiraceae bacterium]
MNHKELICINCPMGCMLSVDIDENGEMTVSGNNCPRGDIYARKELTDPTRIVTSTVSVRNGELPVVSVKTASDIPKDKIGAVMDSLRGVTVEAPVTIGETIVKDAAGTGIDIIATKNVGRQ